MIHIEKFGLTQFLVDYPGMNVKMSDGRVLISGTFEFEASSTIGVTLAETFQISIELPLQFPRALPLVTEMAGRIPREPQFHINTDNTICLGSPLRLLAKIKKKPTLTWFVESCLVPYLYAVAYKLKFGGPFIFGELDHGAPGMLVDYAELFGVKTTRQAHQVIKLLAFKRRHANKSVCPCGCGKKVSRCNFRFQLCKFRDLTNRRWFREQYLLLKSC